MLTNIGAGGGAAAAPAAGAGAGAAAAGGAAEAPKEEEKKEEEKEESDDDMVCTHFSYSSPSLLIANIHFFLGLRSLRLIVCFFPSLCVLSPATATPLSHPTLFSFFSPFANRIKLASNRICCAVISVRRAIKKLQYR